MRPRFTLYNAAAFGLSIVLGWGLRNVFAPVVKAQGADAQNHASNGDGGLAFQLSGIGPETALTVWNGSNHTLYVYQGAVMGSSNVNCTYSFKIERPGAPIRRQNCPIGQLFPGR